jgi:hypothetical protein
MQKREGLCSQDKTSKYLEAAFKILAWGYLWIATEPIMIVVFGGLYLIGELFSKSPRVNGEKT